MTDNQNDKAIVRQYGEFSVDAWLVASSEDSAPAVSPSVTTQKEAGELSVERANILTLIRETDQPDRRKATGPRTELGIQRSSQNALKSGIFSKATLLKSESRSEYKSLLDDLWRTWQPVGKFEEILVEKLASIIWRYRRMLMAEGAEIRKSSEFVIIDQRFAEQEEAEEINKRRHEGVGLNPSLERVGLRWSIRNPSVLKRCIELLVEMRQKVEINGLDKDRDYSILQTIYGDPGRPHLRGSLYDDYLAWLRTAQVHESVRQAKGYPTPERCKEIVLQLIYNELNHINKFKKQLEQIESERTKLEILRQNVPDSQVLDRLLRYESCLERAFDRTLAQLERLQRIRKGQPLPPQLDVKIS